MSENIKVLQVAKTPDRVEALAYMTYVLFKNKLVLSMKPFEKAELEKLTALMIKSKKDIEFCASFDGDTVKYFARVGTVKMYKETDPKGAAKLSDYPPFLLEKRDEILDGLMQYGIATKGQVDALKKRPVKV